MGVSSIHYRQLPTDKERGQEDADHVIPRYNIGILASIQVHPGFVDEMGELTAVRRGVITAIYYVGTWTGYVFISHPASDRLGRRYAALIGTAVLAVGTAFEAGATRPHVYAMWIVGRIICGLGVSMLSTSVPLYQA